MDSAFLSMMPLTVHLSSTSPTGFGNQRTDVTPISPDPHAHIENDGKEITNIDGTTVHQEGNIYLDGVYAIDTTYSCVIPIPGGTRSVKIVGVDQNTDEVGFYNTVLHFGAL